MKNKIATAAIVFLTIMSCNNSKTSNSEIKNTNTEDPIETTSVSEITTIENVKWIISTIDGVEVRDSEVNGQDIYFILDSETHRVSGNSGCNAFMGTYTIEDGRRMSFSPLGATRMMCPDMKIKESQIFSIFETVAYFTISGQTLELQNEAQDPIATFKADYTEQSVVGKSWALKSLAGNDITSAENQEQPIYFKLKTNSNRVIGFTGCNSFSGQYTLKGEHGIHFTKMLATLRACSDERVNEAEFLKVFEQADYYTINEGELTLNTKDKTPLAVFEQIDLD